MIRDNVRAFVRERLLPHVGDWFEQGMLPRELAPELGKLGVLGMHLEGYGCAGASATAYGIVCQELEAGDSGPALVRLRPGLARDVRDLALRLGGAEAGVAAADGRGRGDRLLRPDRARRRLGPGSMRTTRASATATTGCSTAPRCGSRTARSPTWPSCGRAPTTASAASSCPRDTPGFTHAGHPQEAVAARVGDLRADPRRRAPARRRRSCPRPTGLRAPLACLSEARFGIVWGAIGAARACYEAALEYAGQRDAVRQADRRLPADPGEAGRHAGRGQPGRAAGAAPRPHEGRRDAAARARLVGKLANVNAALEVCREARQILGANGITLEYPVIRHMNNLESVVTYEGTAEIHTLVLGPGGHRPRRRTADAPVACSPDRAGSSAVRAAGS